MFVFNNDLIVSFGKDSFSMALAALNSSPSHHHAIAASPGPPFAKSANICVTGEVSGGSSHTAVLSAKNWKICREMNRVMGKGPVELERTH